MLFCLVLILSASLLWTPLWAGCFLSWVFFVALAAAADVVNWIFNKVWFGTAVRQHFNVWRSPRCPMCLPWSCWVTNLSLFLFRYTLHKQLQGQAKVHILCEPFHILSHYHNKHCICIIAMLCDRPETSACLGSEKKLCKLFVIICLKSFMNLFMYAQNGLTPNTPCYSIIFTVETLLALQ